MLYTYDTADVLYVQPVKSLGLTEEGVTTMQYALEKSIEQHYNIEPVEIDARLMGSEEYKNIMLYESAEGSIGVLKDIARNPAKLREIFLKAYEICGYDFNTKTDLFPTRPKASYDDLLSYYNQLDHTIINRHSIIKALELLISSNPDDTIGGTYEEKYEELKKGLHNRSPGEKNYLTIFLSMGTGCRILLIITWSSFMYSQILSMKRKKPWSLLMAEYIKRLLIKPMMKGNARL